MKTTSRGYAECAEAWGVAPREQSLLSNHRDAYTHQNSALTAVSYCCVGGHQRRSSLHGGRTLIAPMFHHLDVFYGSETGTAQVRRKSSVFRAKEDGGTVNFRDREIFTGGCTVLQGDRTAVSTWTSTAVTLLGTGRGDPSLTAAFASVCLLLYTGSEQARPCKEATHGCVHHLSSLLHLLCQTRRSPSTLQPWRGDGGSTRLRRRLIPFPFRTR